MSAMHRLRLVTVAGTTVATLAVTASVAPVSAAPRPVPRQTSQQTAEGQARMLVPSGLDNPRHLAFDRRGRLYVAEAGRGGKGPCMKGPEGGQVCFGTSGAVSVIGRRGAHHRVASGFPSLAAPDGTSALGPADLVIGQRGQFVLSIGLGANPSVRKTLPRVGRRFMGTLTTARFGSATRSVLADLSGYEAAKDPDRAGPDSNPVGFIRRGSGFVAADAGGNDIVAVSSRGKVMALRTFAARSVPSPMGGPAIKMQSVPTTVVAGPHGVLFVSELTGFPFPARGARIYRVAPHKPVQVYARGLTNVTDLAWYRGHLYAVQISDVGLAAEKGLPHGSLVRVRPGRTPVTLAKNLPAPYGVAIRGGTAYVTTCTVCKGGGGVATIPVR
ncbi:MAG: hypothetical protein JWQ15_1959 [Marmoricola sp.]|nr:hypothetical protein [Marmoricola sp.]